MFGGAVGGAQGVVAVTTGPEDRIQELSWS